MPEADALKLVGADGLKALIVVGIGNDINVPLMRDGVATITDHFMLIEDYEKLSAELSMLVNIICPGKHLIIQYYFLNARSHAFHIL